MRTHAIDVLRELVVRDVKLRYRRSVLGIAWSQIGPLVTLLVLSFVFSKVVPIHAAHYPELVFVALMPWIWFQTGITAAIESVVAGRDLIRQPGFNPILLPTASIASNMANYVLALPILVVFVAAGTGRLPWTLVLLPVVVGLQFLVMLGPSLMLASWHVAFRDVLQIVSVLLIPLFYITPIVYPASNVPARFKVWYDLNPLAHLITAYRSVMIDGRVPDVLALIVVAAVGVVLVYIGRAVFRARSDRFVEEL